MRLAWRPRSRGSSSSGRIQGCASSVRTRPDGREPARSADHVDRSECRRKRGIPRTAPDRPRLDLRQIDIPQRKDRQRLEQRAGFVRQREDDTGLVHVVAGLTSPADQQEARDVVRVILNLGTQNLETEDLGGAFRGDRRCIRELLFLDQLRAAGRIVGRFHRHAGHAAQEPLALRQRLGMRQYPPHILQRSAGQRHQVVRDRQRHLADNGQIVFEEQVVVAVNTAADRVLDRQDAVCRLTGRDCGEDVLERLAGEKVGMIAETKRGGLAVRSRFALEGDAHGPDRLQRSLLMLQIS